MESISQIVKRRRLVKRLVVGAIVLTVAAIAGGYLLKRRGPEAASQPIAPVGKDVQQQASGYTFTRSDEGRQVFTIRASRTVAFKEGGTTVLEGVEVEVFGKDGTRRDILRTGQCDYNSQSGDLFSSGQVEIELGAPLSGPELGPAVNSVKLQTSRLHFRQQGSIVESEAPVNFQYGSLVGSAMGLRYATREGRLELLKEVRLDLHPVGAAGPPVLLTASRAQFEKEKRELTFTGGAEVTQGKRRASAPSARIYLDSRNHLSRAVFEGPVRAVDGETLTASAGRLTTEFDGGSEALQRAVAENDFRIESRRPSSVSSMNGVKMELTFAGTPARAASGVASGRVHMTQEVVGGAGVPSVGSASPGKLPTSRRALMTEEIEFTFRESGRSLKDAATTGPARLAMVPADPRAGERQVTARRMSMSFDVSSRLETIRGEGGTTIYFVPGKDAPPGSVGPTSAADRLVANIDPATETLLTLDQIGNFHYYEGDRHATADQASYDAATDSLTLTGKPRVWDAEMRARAVKILIDVEKGRAEGVGKVESTHVARAGRGEPTSVLADRVVADRRSQTVHYEGNVRAWRGSDVVESQELEILRAERRVSSGSKVLTSHMQPAAEAGQAAKNGKSPTRPATIRADHLEYSDQGRKAVYRGNVRLQTEDTVLEAARLDAYFAGTGNALELDRAVAEGGVKVTQPGRRATGNHAEYFSAEGKIVLTGGPPALYDAEKGFTSGRSLTFYSRDDRLVVSGGDDSSTISRHRIGQ